MSAPHSPGFFPSPDLSIHLRSPGGECPSLTDTFCILTCPPTSAKINISYSILFNLTTSYSSYFGGKKGISRNKTSIFLLMHVCSSGFFPHPDMSVCLQEVSAPCSLIFFQYSPSPGGECHPLACLLSMS